MTIQWYVCSFVDVFGRTGSVVVPAASFDDAVADGIPFDGSALEGRARVLESDMRLRPDPSTVVELEDGRALAWGAVIDASGAPWAVDPRTALGLGRRSRARARGRAPARRRARVLSADADGQPVDRARYYSDFDGPGADVVLQVAATLAGRGRSDHGGALRGRPGSVRARHRPAGAARVRGRGRSHQGCVAASAAARRADGHVHGAAAPRRAGFRAARRQASPLLLGGDGKLTDAGSWFVAGQLAHASGLSRLPRARSTRTGVCTPVPRRRAPRSGVT